MYVRQNGGCGAGIRVRKNGGCGAGIRVRKMVGAVPDLSCWWGVSDNVSREYCCLLLVDKERVEDKTYV